MSVSSQQKGICLNFICLLFTENSKMSCSMTKPTNDLYAQRRLRSACASTYQSSLCAQWVAKTQDFFSGQLASLCG